MSYAYHGPPELTRVIPFGGFESGACVIKGNISSSGERIYHVPGQRYYDATWINPFRGERWFCTEAEARAAGYGSGFKASTLYREIKKVRYPGLDLKNLCP